MIVRRWTFAMGLSRYQKPGIETSWIRETSTLNPTIPRHRKADTSKGVSSILMASKVPARRKSKAICNATPRRLRSWRNKVFPKTNPNQKQSSCTVGRNPANQLRLAVYSIIYNFFYPQVVWSPDFWSINVLCPVRFASPGFCFPCCQWILRQKKVDWKAGNLAACSWDF